MCPSASGPWGDLHFERVSSPRWLRRCEQAWERVPEICRWEVTVDRVRLRCDERWLRLDPERHILYPELVYRRYVDDAWVEDAVLPANPQTVLRA